MKPIPTSESKAQRAFTLTELLVVIVTLVLLAVFVLPAFAASKEKSRRAECVNNLHQSSLALQMYADQNNDWLPLAPNPDPTGNNRRTGTSLWDLPAWVGGKLTEGGRRNRIMFCPELVNDGRPKPDDIWLSIGDYVTTQYYWLFKRNDPRDSFPDGSLATGNANYPLMTPAHRFIRRMSVSWTNTVALAESELVTDVVISEGNGTVSDKFSGVIASSLIIANAGGYKTSHMAGRLPDGGNILFQDGHVGWRPFDQMKKQVDWNNARYFWW